MSDPLNSLWHKGAAANDRIGLEGVIPHSADASIREIVELRVFQVCPAAEARREGCLSAGTRWMQGFQPQGRCEGRDLSDLDVGREFALVNTTAVSFKPGIYQYRLTSPRLSLYMVDVRAL